MGWVMCPQCQARGQYKVNGKWVNCRHCGGTDTKLGSGAIDDTLPAPAPERKLTSRWRFLTIVGGSVATLIVFTLASIGITHLFNISLVTNPPVMAAATYTAIIITATPTCPPPPPPDAPPWPPPGQPPPAAYCPRPPTPTPLPTPGGPTSVVPALQVYPSSFSHYQCYHIRDIVTVRNGGSGTIFWAASDNNTTYVITPASGEVVAGKVQNVTIEHVVQSGSVTFTSNGGNVVITENCNG